MPVPMITCVQDVYYNITDRERAVRFYSGALGMKCTMNEEYWVAMDCHAAHGQATLTLRSNDVKEDRARIEKHGGKILAENDQQWGHMLVFEDPDGNVLKLMNPKY